MSDFFNEIQSITLLIQQQQTSGIYVFLTLEFSCEFKNKVKAPNDF